MRRLRIAPLAGALALALPGAALVAPAATGAATPARSARSVVWPGRARQTTPAAPAAAPAAETAPAAAPGGTSAPADVVPAAIAWLESQQQPDGGFDTVGFPGFETPDAILAIAAAAQSDETWSAAEARAAVAAVRQATTAKTPLDALDDLAEGVLAGSSGGANPGQAAKLIALDVAPLGLDPADVDPSADSPTPVDLLGTLRAAAGADQSYAGLTFNGKLFAAVALDAAGQAVPEALVQSIRDAQQADGGWGFAGDPSASGLDPDTTGLALQALVGASVPATDPAVGRALALLAEGQSGSGLWGSPFDDGNPNSTALAVLGVRAATNLPARARWRATVAEAWAGVPYDSPLTALARAQAPDGHIASPGDEFGVNTFGTSQAIEALLWDRLPFPSGTRPFASAAAPRDFVHAAYRDLLGRLADASGEAFFTDRLRAGRSRSWLARALVGSAEYRGRVIDAAVVRLLGRPPTDADRTALSAIAAQDGWVGVQGAVLGSDEYFGSGTVGRDDATWVDAAYQEVLGRSADPAGRSYWVARIASGTTRTEVARALLGSGEGRRRIVRGRYLALLRRPADDAGLAYWSDRLGSGGTVEQVLAGLVASAEYAGLVAASA
ncbi:MAG: DUF4214 domain-containing protein [Actinobacteria bacterium]|nr:DUF4214 domain-containing protein [Actinomycetota bacterium]